MGQILMVQKKRKNKFSQLSDFVYKYLSNTTDHLIMPHVVRLRLLQIKKVLPKNKYLDEYYNLECFIKFLFEQKHGTDVFVYNIKSIKKYIDRFLSQNYNVCKQNSIYCPHNKSGTREVVCPMCDDNLVIDLVQRQSMRTI